MCIFVETLSHCNIAIGGGGSLHIWCMFQHSFLVVNWLCTTGGSGINSKTGSYIYFLFFPDTGVHTSFASYFKSFALSIYLCIILDLVSNVEKCIPSSSWDALTAVSLAYLVRGHFPFISHLILI